MCPQGALNDFEFELLNPLTMDAVVDLLLIVRYRMALKFSGTHQSRVKLKFETSQLNYFEVV